MEQGMSDAEAAPADAKNDAESGGFLGWIERVGNKVPHPVIIFLYLIVAVIVLSAILSLLNVGITEQMLVPAPKTVDTGTSIAGGTYAPLDEPAGFEVNAEGDVDV